LPPPLRTFLGSRAAAAGTALVAMAGAGGALLQEPAAKRRRRRAFAWESSGSEAPPEAAAGAASESSGEERSSSASSSRHREFGTADEEPWREAVVWHSTVAKVDYFAIRAQAAAASAPGLAPPLLASTSQSPPLAARPPPLGARPVARRRQRLLGLRNSGSPAAELQLAGGATSALAQHGLAGGCRSIARPGLRGPHRDVAEVCRGSEVDEHTAFGIALMRWQSALDALVAALRPLLSRPGELAGVRARELAMASCYPPGARYIRHYDNNCEDGGSTDCNGRRLTAVYYLTDVPSDTCGCHLRLAVARGASDVS